MIFMETGSLLWQRLLCTLFGLSFLTKQELPIVTSRVHLFGSGPSARLTVNLVEDGDICYACNLAIKWRPYWDYVFIEKLDRGSFGKEQMTLLKKISYSFLICKNNYPYHPFQSLYKIFTLRKFPRLYLLPECQKSPNHFLSQGFLTNIANKNHNFVFPQYASSVLTMLFFAVRSGAKEIWLHGVDSLVRAKSSDDVHATELYQVPFSEIFSVIRTHYECSGIKIKIVLEGA